MSGFQVSINNKTINGLFIPFDESQINPNIKFRRIINKNYTIIIVDPNAPSWQNPINI